MTWIDFHTHCLPHMDDGAADAEISIEMLQHLHNQNVDAAVASPHFYAQQESLESFLTRRAESYSSIWKTVEFLTLPKVILAAEVHLLPNISAMDLTPLRLGESPYILLELPDHPYQQWLGQEIRTILEKWGLIPIMAHLERYIGKYSTRDYSDILSIPNCICQFSVGALTKPSINRFATRLIQQGHTVILGSDCHNLTTRPPNFTVISQLWKKRQTKELINAIWGYTHKVWRNQFF